MASGMAGEWTDREGRKAGNKKVVLSRRMQMLADMVTAGSRVADVGCDHGLLPIYLVRTGKSPKCLAMDVRKGPLSGAEKHIAFCGLGEYIETRLSDGLMAYHIGEAETLVCAGMGGRLMERILTEGGEKSRSFAELILQPQSEIPEFRRFLRNAGYLITGEYLLRGRHPVLKQYLQKRLRAVEELIGQLRRKDSVRSGNRQRELILEKEQLESALELFEKGR